MWGECVCLGGVAVFLVYVMCGYVGKVCVVEWLCSQGEVWSMIALLVSL